MNTAALADEIRMNGYTVLEQAYPREKVADMLERFDVLLDAKRKAEPSNRGANRFQMHLPFEMPFADPEFYANPIVLEILENLFGKDMICTYFASDTPFPGSDYQPVHLDTRLPFPEAAYGVPVYSVVLNLPLIDYTEANGPLEMWPGGTHLIGQPHDMERMAATMPSIKPLLKAGDLLLRDARMWHRARRTGASAPARTSLPSTHADGSGLKTTAIVSRFRGLPTRGSQMPPKKMFRYCALLNADGSISDVE